MSQKSTTEDMCANLVCGHYRHRHIENKDCTAPGCRCSRFVSDVKTFVALWSGQQTRRMCGNCLAGRTEHGPNGECPRIMDGAVTVVAPTDLRNRVGMFMMEKGCKIGAKVDCGDVQDWITEFAAHEVASLLESISIKTGKPA